MSAIYAKTLRLQSGVYDESKAVTLMSTDVDRIATNIENVLEIWSRTAEIGIAIWLLERQLGWVCVAPVLVIIGMTLSFMSPLDVLIISSLYLWGF